MRIGDKDVGVDFFFLGIGAFVWYGVATAAEKMAMSTLSPSCMALHCLPWFAPRL